MRSDSGVGRCPSTIFFSSLLYPVVSNCSLVLLSRDVIDEVEDEWTEYLDKKPGRMLALGDQDRRLLLVEQENSSVVDETRPRPGLSLVLLWLVSSSSLSFSALLLRINKGFFGR